MLAAKFDTLTSRAYHPLQVLENTCKQRITAPERCGFFTSALPSMGGVRLPVRLAAWLFTGFQHPARPTRLKTSPVGVTQLKQENVMVKSTKNPLVYTFHDQSIQAVFVNGEAWFNAVQICRVLGHLNSRQAIKTHVYIEDVKKIDNLTNGGVQKVNFVNESGLYALIFGSAKPQAKEFKHWVTSKVLPSIRKTGEFTAKKRLPAKPKYHYPASLLRQPHFVRPDGALMLGASSLVNENFVSPLLSLLNQLRADGHEIEGAFNEAIALRRSIKESVDAFDQINTICIRARMRDQL